MQTQCHWHEECQCIWDHFPPTPMPTNSLDIVAVLDDDSNIDSCPRVEISESEGGIWPDHSNVAHDYSHNCDPVGPIIVEPNPDPSPPVIAS